MNLFFFSLFFFGVDFFIWRWYNFAMRVCEFFNIKGDKEARVCLSSFVLNSFPSLSRNVLFKAIRNKDIKVNGKRVSKDMMLKSGDVLNIYISDLYLFNLPKQLEYVYKDDNLLGVYKPQGLLSNNEYYDEEDNTNIDEPTLEDLVKKDFPSAKICHRLDRNTSGIVLFSLNEVAYNELLFGFKVGAIVKNYIAYVYDCNFKSEHETLEKYLKKDSKSGYSKVYDSLVKDSQKIITEYFVIYKNEIKDYAILDVSIHTGKTHQIRAQLKEISHPIIGDSKYGKNSINKQFKIYKQLLFAYKYSFKFKEKSPLFYLNSKTILLQSKYYENKIT